MQRILSILSVLLTVHALAACANVKPAPVYPHQDPEYGKSAEVATGLDNDPPMPLTLMPGDTLTVRTASNESHEYPNLVVDSEGKVHVPVIGAAQVAGLAPQQAERTIEGMMQKFDRYVRVSVLVSEWSGHTATVIGAVVSEGPKQLAPGMRLAELIAAAGGPLRTTEREIVFMADLENAKLVRENKVVPVNLNLALNGDPRHNIFVHAGDQLFVPVGFGTRVAILGSDARAGLMLNYRRGMRITEALAEGGGIVFASDEEDIRVIRGSLEKPIVYRYDLQALVNGKGHNIELAPGDIVYVTRHWSSYMGEFFERVAPIISTTVAVVSTVLLIKNLELQREIQRSLREERTGGTGMTPAAMTPADGM